jgi:hypothetical protein
MRFFFFFFFFFKAIVVLAVGLVVDIDGGCDRINAMVQKLWCSFGA